MNLLMKGAALAPPFSCTTKYSSDVYSPRPPDIRVRLLPTKPPVHFTTEQPGRDSMVERGEKIPSLETFIKIVNALGVSSDMVLTDVLETGYTVKNSMLNEKLEKLVPADRNRIYEVIDTLVKQSKQILP